MAVNKSSLSSVYFEVELKDAFYGKCLYTMTLSRRHILYALAGIIAATVLLWIGVAGINLNCDDYQYIESMAPIRSVADLFRPFVMTDFNPIWYRPFANLTMAVDFLFFHWAGGSYHLTNLFFHLLATVTVFYFVRSIFGLRTGLALLVSLAFGLNASHEYNLTTDTARADILVAFFIMWTLLAEQKAQRENSLWWKLGGMIAFSFALFSKESAFFVLPLIPWFSLPKSAIRPDWTKLLGSLTPYAIIAIAFLILHSHYGASSAQNPWASLLTMKGIQQDLYQNGMGAGYILFPVDFSAALVIFRDYSRIILPTAALLIASVSWLMWSNRSSKEAQDMLKPLALFFITTLPIVVFARWRFYLPSVALLVMVALCAALLWERGGIVVRSTLSVALIGLTIFHVRQAIADQNDWRLATQWIETLHLQLVPILRQEREQPHSMSFLTLPAKCGDGVVLPIGEDALVKRSEADLLGQSVEGTGNVSRAKISAWTAIHVFSLDASEGYPNLHVDQLGKLHYLVHVPVGGSVVLAPAELSSRGVSILQTKFHTGDTIQSAKCLCTIVNENDGKAYAIDVKVADSTALPVYFDGTTLRKF